MAKCECCNCLGSSRIFQVLLSISLFLLFIVVGVFGISMINLTSFDSSKLGPWDDWALAFHGAEDFWATALELAYWFGAVECEKSAAIRRENQHQQSPAKAVRVETQIENLTIFSYCQPKSCRQPLTRGTMESGKKSRWRRHSGETEAKDEPSKAMRWNRFSALNPVKNIGNEAAAQAFSQWCVMTAFFQRCIA
eukprot:Skav217788  [mRNA]  locus=scaffold1782:271937:276547:- [translate_table: standard]